MRTIADGKVVIDSYFNKKPAEKGISDLQRSLQGASKKAKQIGTNMTKYLTLPLMALGTAAFVAADDLDKAYNDIRVGTGATGDDLEGLKEDFKAVFEDIPTDSSSAANALANLNTYTGATGETLQDMTKSVLEASRVLGEDGVANSEAFGQAMEQWQIPAEEGPGKIDKLFKATQEYGVGLGTITGHLSEYGSVLQNAGFTMDESADLFGRLEKNGISVSRIMPGLNMAFRNWASEGKNSQEELQKTIEKMQNAEDETEALSIATEEFGAEGAQRLTTAIRNGAFPALDDLGGVLEGTEGLVNETAEETKTFGDRMLELKNQAQLGLEPVGDILIDLAEKWLPPVIGFVQQLAEWFANLSPTGQMLIVVIGGIVALLGPLLLFGTMIISMFAGLATVAGALGIGMLPLIGIIAGVIAAIAAIIAIGVLLWKNWDTVKEKAVQIWGAVKGFFISIWNGIKSFFTTTLSNIWRTAVQKFNDMKNSIRDKMNGVFTTIKEIWNKAKDFLANIDLFQIGKDIIQGMINGIGSMGSAVWNAAKGIAGSVKDSITGFFKMGSPSKLMREDGQYIGEGMELGMEDSISSLAKQAQKMAGAAMPDVSGFVNRMRGMTVPIGNVIPVQASVNGTSTRSSGASRGDQQTKQPAIINFVINGRSTMRALIDDVNELQGNQIVDASLLGGNR